MFENITMEWVFPNLNPDNKYFENKDLLCIKMPIKLIQ